MIIKFCGKTDTNANNSPFHPCLTYEKPTVNPTTTPFTNNKIKISGKPIIQIPENPNKSDVF